MRAPMLFMLSLITASAAAQDAHSPYGLNVSDAELRFMSAMHSLAVDLELGRRGPADPARAAETYRKAAVLGYPFAQNNLARLYETGLGVPKDPVTAHMWYLIAAANGDATVAMNRDRSAGRLRNGDLIDAEKLAETLRKHLPAPSR